MSSNLDEGALPAAEPEVELDDDALLAALILAPQAFSRNRFFTMFEAPEKRRIRRRAARVRGIIRQLLQPERGRAELVGERILEDGRVLLRYTINEIGFARTAALSQLEAGVLRYALAKAGKGTLNAADGELVREALSRLSEGLQLELPA